MTSIVFTYFADFDAELLCNFSFEVSMRNEYFQAGREVVVVVALFVLVVVVLFVLVVVVLVVVEAVVKNVLELGQTGGCALY